MYLKRSLLYFKSKEKEFSPSFIGIELIQVTTGVDYTTTIDPKPTREELYNIGNALKTLSWKNRGKQILKVENEKMEKQIIHIKIYIFKKMGKNSTIEKNGSKWY